MLKHESQLHLLFSRDIGTLVTPLSVDKYKRKASLGIVLNYFPPLNVDK